MWRPVGAPFCVNSDGLGTPSGSRKSPLTRHPSSPRVAVDDRYGGGMTSTRSPTPRTRPARRPPRSLADLVPDSRNANRGTDRGRAALERSLREYGPGRAVLIDRQGRI